MRLDGIEPLIAQRLTNVGNGPAAASARQLECSFDR
jgi:hypothetical protein